MWRQLPTFQQEPAHQQGSPRSLSHTRIPNYSHGTTLAQTRLIIEWPARAAETREETGQKSGQMHALSHLELISPIDYPGTPDQAFSICCCPGSTINEHFSNWYGSTRTSKVSYCFPMECLSSCSLPMKYASFRDHHVILQLPYGRASWAKYRLYVL